MPELPEVETTLRGITPYLQNTTIENTIVREARLRWPVIKILPSLLQGKKVLATRRRGKYLIFSVNGGELILHLGMSGSLRLVEPSTAVQKHDHIDWHLSNNKVLRFTDPRRFGAVIWSEDGADQHALICDLGPEPLAVEFSGALLFQRSRGRKQAIKNFIMDSHIVVGVGNIYANEALFLAGIRPSKRAGKVSAAQYQVLADVIKQVLTKAIAAGGTTLRDFVGGDGKPGYFKQELFVYGREGETCRRCAGTLKSVRIGQRASTYCPHCQS